MAQGTVAASINVTILFSVPVGQPQPSRAGFVVCAGTAGDRDKFGRETTPVTGIANQAFRSLTSGMSVLVTVHKPGYVTWERQLTLQPGWNQVVARPQPGSGGSNCDSETDSARRPLPDGRLTPYVPPPGITSFSVNNTDRIKAGDVIRLFVTTSGTAPTEIRVSETSAQFPETWATWQPYRRLAAGYLEYPTLNRQLASTTVSKKTIFLQVRAGNVLSPVASDDFTIVKDFKLTGVEAFQNAQLRGFSFGTTPLGCQISKDRLRGDGGQPLLTVGTAATLVVLPAACLFDLFAGRSLSTGWTFESFSFDSRALASCTYAWDRQAAAGSQTIDARLKLTVPFGSGCLLIISNVTLRGPIDHPWTEAFNR